MFELGIYSFAETTPDPITGQTISPARRLADLLEEIELADQVGLDVYGLGEHHRADYSVSSPAIVLAAAAERTRHIRLGTGVVSLPYHHPLMVADRIVLLDHLTRGRIDFGVGPGGHLTDARMLGIDHAGARVVVVALVVRLVKPLVAGRLHVWEIPGLLGSGARLSSASSYKFNSHRVAP